MVYKRKYLESEQVCHPRQCSLCILHYSVMLKSFIDDRILKQLLRTPACVQFYT